MRIGTERLADIRAYDGPERNVPLEQLSVQCGLPFVQAKGVNMKANVMVRAAGPGKSLLIFPVQGRTPARLDFQGGRNAAGLHMFSNEIWAGPI